MKYKTKYISIFVIENERKRNRQRRIEKSESENKNDPFDRSSKTNLKEKALINEPNQLDTRIFVQK